MKRELEFMLSRRRFLELGGAAGLIAASPFAHSQAEGSGARTLSVDLMGGSLNIPADFTGLSYESAQLANPGYFSASNKPLVALCRLLGRDGVLRIGGNTSDFDEWKPEHPPRTATWNQPVGPDAGLDIGKRTVVTEASVDELKGFLKATGWRLLYGIDLGHGDADSAADEAAYVVKTIGSSLVALQIGNEADLFYRNGMRKADYGYSDFFAEWKRFADAILAKTPGAPLAGPDIGNHYPWIDQFAHQAKGIRLLTSHYYAEGPPTSPAADIPHLLKSHPALIEHTKAAVATGREVGLPYRMAEGNSCYHGGKAGVSDAFASALWGVDFMLQLAQIGVVGVNFHGGGQGHYTPIAGGGAKPYEARPLFYGMLMFRELASAPLLPVNLEAGDVNATAFATRQAKGPLKLLVINKDADHDLVVKLQGPALMHPLREIALTGPSLESLSGTVLGGGAVTAAGSWTGAYSSVTSVRKSILSVPKSSALLVEFA